jgi:hypothetical protein
MGQDGLFAVVGVAIMIAVEEVCSDLSQIARPDWLATQHTERLRAGRPASHQDESHVESPNAKQNTLSDRTMDGGAAQPAFVHQPLLAAVVLDPRLRG